MDANPNIKAVTDASGFFELGLQDLDGDGNADGLAAPEFFVHIDGSTAIGAPAGSKYATLGKPFHSVPGQRVQLRMDGAPVDADPSTPGDQFHIYLPPMSMGDIVTLEPGVDTTVGFGPSVLSDARLAELFPDLTPEERALLSEMKVTYPAGSAMNEDGTPATQAMVIPVNPDRLPAPLPGGANPKLVVSIQAGTSAGFNLAGGSTNFDVPAPVTFPNLEGLAPGEKSLIWSFDHDAGKWIVIGTGTVSPDGRTISSDPGVGVLAPGWHYTVSGSLPSVTPGSDLSDRDEANALTILSCSIPPYSLLGSVAQLAAVYIKSQFESYGSALGVTHLDHFLDNSGTPLNYADGSFVSNLVEGSPEFKSQNATIKQYVDQEVQRLIAANAMTGHISIPDSVLQSAGGRIAFRSDANLFWGIHGTQGLTIDGEVDVSDDGSSYSGTLTYTYYDSYGFGVTDTWFADNRISYAGKSANTLMRYLQICGDAHWFPVNVTVTVPIGSGSAAPSSARVLGISGFDYELAPPATATNAVSEAAGFGSDPVVYYRYTLDNGVELTGKTKLGASLDSVVVPPGVNYTAVFYAPSINRSTVISGKSAASGFEFTFEDNTNSLSLVDFGGIDTDSDGIPDIGELAIGTDSKNRDSDHDGISDDAELVQGTNPLDDTGFPTGVISSLPLSGTIAGITVSDSMAYVATGSHGLAIVDGAKFDNPIILGQIDLDGNATDVGVEPSLNLAAVAAGSTLQIVDVSDPMVPVLQRIVNAGASRVEVSGGFAFVTSGTGLNVVDLLSGDLIGKLALPGAGDVTDLARDGSTLYAYISSSDTLAAIDIRFPEAPVVLGQTNVSIASSDIGISAGNGLVWLAGSGLRTVDVSNPSAPVLQHNADVFFTASRVALNGSGLGLVLPDGGNFVQLYGTSDPNNTANLLTQFTLSGSARAVAISRGIGSVGAGNRLEVINYRPFDTNGIAPTAALTVDAVDIDDASPGVQVLAGGLISVKASVTDDVQVRNVELLVNGTVVANDVSFPFDFVIPATNAAGVTSMNLQVRATDTGGNSTTSPATTLAVVPDTFAPEVVSISPADGTSRFFGTNSVRIRFDEPLRPESVSATSVSLLSAGANGTLGDSDDVVVPATLTLRDSDRLVQMTAAELPEGEYRIRIDRAAISDVAGNVFGTGILTSDFTIQARPTADNLFALRGEDKPGAFILEGTEIRLGIADDGSFITGNTGLQFAGTDFLREGDPLAGYTVSFDNQNFTNAAESRGTAFEVSLQDLSAGAFHGMRAEGTIQNKLKMERVVAYNDGEQFITFAVRVTNVSATILTRVAFLEDHDPDQGTPIGVGPRTNNDVVMDGQLALASVVTDTFPAGLTMGFGSGDDRSKVSLEQFFVGNPFDVLDSPEDPNGALSDTGLNIAFDLGDLAPGESATLVFPLVIGRSIDEAIAAYESSGYGTSAGGPAPPLALSASQPDDFRQIDEVFSASNQLAF